MKKIISTTLFLVIFFGKIYAQSKKYDLLDLEISGSVDTYWKYDFQKQPNINTYFTEDNNSVSIGMVDLALKKTTGKASFVGELSFGPRGQYRSILNGDGQAGDDKNSFHIQNLYISYALTEKLSLTAGFMGTFVGYEVICPSFNFHYSTSYLFGAGPFQDAGLKAQYAFSDKVGLMVGIFNDWNVYQDLNGVSHIGSQLSVTPNEKSSFYLNFLTGSSQGGAANYSSGTLIDFVGNYSFSPLFSLGANATNYNRKGEGGYSGVALYPKVNINENIGIGIRGEYFKTKEMPTTETSSNKIIATTLTANFKHHGFTFIPEIRLDNSDSQMFVKQDLSPTKNAGQFSLALVYAF
ncbi:outer membrane beta-barrel protein [Sphingobacterium faecium]|jgi:hypothetical protein|uniref:outer membrane beta-barrel protein n=1 Tax=Sphingobacterium faecium TaxID=34087 RepID=UPI0012910374|nr:outer membrane beta-barrel protein [Sphingobacterium faecium]MQP28452.1 outer membrane beta-barrel protein [Sphingobacterium faecium]